MSAAIGPALRKDLTEQGTRAVDEVKRTGEAVSLPR